MHKFKQYTQGSGQLCEHLGKIIYMETSYPSWSRSIQLLITLKEILVFKQEYLFTILENETWFCGAEWEIQ